MRRHGLSFIELLVVISVIAVLAGLLLAVLPGGRARKAANIRLANQIGDAVATYLVRWPLLPDDFSARPYRYLHHGLVARGEPPLIELPVSRLLDRTADGGLAPAIAADRADAIRDFGGSGTSELRVWVAPPRPATTTHRPFTHAVGIWTDSGTSDPQDDVHVSFLVADSQWVWLDHDRFLVFQAAQTPLP